MASPKVAFPPVTALPANHTGIETIIHRKIKPTMVTSKLVRVMFPIIRLLQATPVKLHWSENSY
jgi:hypothetical protein